MFCYSCLCRGFGRTNVVEREESVPNIQTRNTFFLGGWTYALQDTIINHKSNRLQMHKYTSWTRKIQKQGPYGTNKWNKFGHHIQFKQHITTPTAIYIHMHWNRSLLDNIFRSQQHVPTTQFLGAFTGAFTCSVAVLLSLCTQDKLSYIDLVYLFCLNCTCLLEVSNFTVLWNLLAQQRAMLLERAGGGMSFFRQRYRLMAWGGRVGRNNVQAPMFDVTLWPPHLNLHVQSSYI